MVDKANEPWEAGLSGSVTLSKQEIRDSSREYLKDLVEARIQNMLVSMFDAIDHMTDEKKAKGKPF